MKARNWLKLFLDGTAGDGERHYWYMIGQMLDPDFSQSGESYRPEELGPLEMKEMHTMLCLLSHQ